MKKKRWVTRPLFAAIVGGLSACTGLASASFGTGVGFATGIDASGVCNSAVASAPILKTVPTANVRVPGNPFGVASSADGRWSFVALTGSVEVMANRKAKTPTGGPDRFVVPVPVHRVKLGRFPFPVGARLTHDGRHLLFADSNGAVVINVAKAERGKRGAIAGTLSAKGQGGAIEVVVSPDDRFAFVSMEETDSLAVFDLHKAFANGFRPSDFVGTVPLGIAPVGLAVSPDGKLIYATSELNPRGGHAGTLSVIDLRQAETKPARAVVATVSAGCNPVRVITSADGRVVWVTARGGDAVLGFSAAQLLHHPRHAQVAKVQVGSAPVGLALTDDGKRLVVADSNRFQTKGASADLAVLDVRAALAGRPALLGLIKTGKFPREVTVIPHTQTLLVGDFGSDRVQAVDVGRLP